MAFSDFKSIQQVQQAYNIRYEEDDYVRYDEITPSSSFMEEFDFSRRHIDVFSSEASRCENVIYPIIRDVYKHHVGKYSLWSHKSLSYDDVLTGTPDYIITSKSSLGKTVLGRPVIIIVEAKQNNFTEGWGQCLAELLASQKINGDENAPVHGIVTDGELWHFGKLIGDLFVKNETVLAISELKKLFGAIPQAGRDLQSRPQCFCPVSDKTCEVLKTSQAGRDLQSRPQWRFTLKGFHKPAQGQRSTTLRNEGVE